MNEIGRLHTTVSHGTAIAWKQMGHGQPLVMLHGIGDSHRTWRKVMPLLAQHYWVLTPDLPGHGLSGRPDADYTLDWYAETMLAWMDRLGIDQTYLCGHSFGGGVAQWMILRQASRVQKLALVASGGLGREVAIGIRLASFPVLGRALTPPLMGIGTRALMRQALGRLAREEAAEVDRSVWMNRAPGTGRAFQRTVAASIDMFGQHMQTWAHVDRLEFLPPTILFWGDEDRIIPIRHGQLAWRRVEDATFKAYKGGSHFVHLDEPRRFVDDLRNFLEYPQAPARLRKEPKVESEKRVSSVAQRIANTVALNGRRVVRGLSPS